MNDQETEISELMESVRCEYFPELEAVFSVEKSESGDAVVGRASVEKGELKVTLYYGDSRVFEPRYRMGLVPVIAHELAHFIDPVDPDRVVRKRLPKAMGQLWEQLLVEGAAQCSMRELK